MQRPASPDASRTTHFEGAMKTLGKFLAGLGIFVMLGPVITGIVVFFMAPGDPRLKTLVHGSVVYGPAGVLLVAAGVLLVRRAFSLRPGLREAGPAPEQFQLALRFRGATLADYDAMIQLERQLTLLLRSTATVAGHDMSASEKHIFIHTPVPEKTFEYCKPLLASVRALDGLTAAYRSFDGNDYEVLWPVQFEGQFAVA